MDESELTQENGRRKMLRSICGFGQKNVSQWCTWSVPGVGEEAWLMVEV